MGQNEHKHTRTLHMLSAAKILLKCKNLCGKHLTTSHSLSKWSEVLRRKKVATHKRDSVTLASIFGVEFAMHLINSIYHSCHLINVGHRELHVHVSGTILRMCVYM